MNLPEPELRSDLCEARGPFFLVCRSEQLFKLLKDPPSRTDPSNYSRPVLLLRRHPGSWRVLEHWSPFLLKGPDPFSLLRTLKNPFLITREDLYLVSLRPCGFRLHVPKLVTGHTHTKLWRPNPDSYKSFSNFVTFIGFGYLTRFLNNLLSSKPEAQVWKVEKTFFMLNPPPVNVTGTSSGRRV